MKNIKSKIRNERHIAILGSDYVLRSQTDDLFKKGYKANTIGMYEAGGAKLVYGHGWTEIIPKNLFTRFKIGRAHV